MKPTKMKTIIMKTSIVCSIILCAVVCTNKVAAQIKPYNENVTVIGNFQPSLSDANKLNTQPVISDTTVTIPALNYNVLTRKYKTSYVTEPIKAARVGEASLTKLYKFLAKVGFGNYTMPYGEFYANNTYSKTFSIGAHLKHLSSSGKLKSYAYPGNSENLIDFYGKKTNKKNVVGGSIAYKRNVYH